MKIPYGTKTYLELLRQKVIQQQYQRTGFLIGRLIKKALFGIGSFFIALFLYWGEE